MCCLAFASECVMKATSVCVAERVAVGDQITMMSVKGDQYLHCGIASYQMGGDTRREVNASPVRPGPVFHRVCCYLHSLCVVSVRMRACRAS